MIFLWHLVFWVVFIGSGVCVVIFVFEIKRHWVKFLISMIVWILFLLFVAVTGLGPNMMYVPIGTINSKIVVDYLDKDKVTGGYIHLVDVKHKIVFTEDTRKIGKFQWGFGWVEYRHIKEDVKTIVGERDNLIYFVSKSTGKVRTMKK